MARNAIRWKFFSSRGDCRHPQFRFEKPGQFAQKDEESGKSGKALPGGVFISDAVCRGGLMVRASMTGIPKASQAN
jgi:hypothetical protein